MAHFVAERRLEAEQIRARLREIQETIYEHRQPIGNVDGHVVQPIVPPVPAAPTSSYCSAPRRGVGTGV